MEEKIEGSFFSVPFDYIACGKELTYDLYVNSSALAGKERFVRVFPKREKLSSEHFEELKDKYHQLYVPEQQRGHYLKSLLGSNQISKESVTKVIKDSAIKYLENIFGDDKEFSTEVLNEAINGSREVVETMVETIKGLSLAELYEMIAKLSYHDFYTYDHSINVSMYCIAIFNELKSNATREEIITVGLGGLLHDLGKLKIPTSIINNPGKLSDEEFDEVKKHPTYGHNLLTNGECHCPGVDLKLLSDIIHQHHENYNGTGYPLGLKGEEISLFARITAIADFFDAITTKRSYHEVLGIEEAVSVMEKSKGAKIDPNLFGKFTQMVKKMALHGKSHRFLPEDFDPCRPYMELPFQTLEAMGTPKYMGKVDTDEATKKGHGKVMWDGGKSKEKK